jgi:two-component system, OmpR family, response regulator ChvI
LEGNDGLSISDLAKEISFLDRSMNCCIGFVDIVNSTQATDEMVSDRQKIGQYYSIFINTMAVLAKAYGAKIVKYAGDALIFYFPDSSDPANEAVFKDILECFTTMILARDIINSKLHSENLPSVSYRISSDYGRVEVASSTSSKREDLFGSAMNICAKINSMAEPNGIVIGGNLYQIIKSFSFINAKYQFRELRGGYSIGFSDRYPLYTAALSNNTGGVDINRINQLFGSDQTPTIKDVRVKQQLQQLQRQQQRYSTNIMVVDDEPDLLFTYECFISDEGYNVQAFTDPQEALKHFVKLSGCFTSYYQLVVLDVRMPRLNGLKLFNTIKTLSPDTKIMFVSALDMAKELTTIFPDIEHNHIIRKPAEREYFINKINSILNK